MEDQMQTILDAIEKLSKKLDTVSKREQRSTELNELFGALAKAQAEMLVAGLNKQNPYFKSKYADLSDIVKASRPCLTKNGLSVLQQILTNDEGQSILHTILAHCSGQYITTQMRIIPPKNDIQTMGSYITYLRRYSYASLIGVVACEDDDDGEIAMIDAREVMAKGPSTKYDPKHQSFETITKEQQEEMEEELAAYPDIAEMVMDKMRIQSLADLPKDQFGVSIKRIREIKQIREGK
jgi:hypothetical protein